jgi:predicted metal-dependent phosphoesterase TrpH
MSEQPRRRRTLREIELEVEAEGREWMRQRLEERLQKEAEREGAVFPPQPKKGAASTRPGADAKKQRRHC